MRALSVIATGRVYRRRGRDRTVAPDYAARMTTKKQRERERRYRRHGVDRPESPQRDAAAHREAEPKEKQRDRKSTRLNSSHVSESRMPSSA